jgi:hypothetical protein
MQIGLDSSLSFSDNKWVLEMGNGDRKLCSKPRRSKVSKINLKTVNSFIIFLFKFQNEKIIFECDLDEKLTRIEEPEQCVYVFYLNTPAAC